MTTAPVPTEKEHHEPKVIHAGGGSDSVYGLGMIGAWVYYFKGVTTFRQGLEAFFKGIFWPAFMIYDLLVFLKKE